MVSFDPCTCQLNDNSLLEISLNSTETQVISADLNGTLTEFSNDSFGGPTNQNDQSWMDDINGLYKAGAEKKASWEELQTNLDGTLTRTHDIYNWVLKQQLDALDTEFPNTPELFSNSGVDLSTLPEVLQGDIQISDILLWDESVMQEYEDAYEDVAWDRARSRSLTGQSETFADFIKGAKNVVGIFPHIGTAIGMFEHLVNGKGNDSSPSSNSSGPVITNVDLTLSGTLFGDFAEADVEIYTPGSNPETLGGSANAVYDNTLGVVHLLKSPNFKRADYLPQVNHVDLEIEDPNEDGDINLECFEGWQAGFKPISQFKVNSIPQIALNPAARLKPISAEASFVFDYSNGSNSFPAPTEGLLISNGESIFRDINIAQPIFSDSGMDLEFMLDGSDDLHFNKEKLRFRTTYKSLECLTDESFFLMKKTSTEIWPEIFLKVIYTFEPIDSTDELVTIVHTYDLNGALESAQVIGSDIYGIDFTCVNMGDEFPFAQITGFPNGILLPDPDYYQDQYFSNTSISNDVFGATITIGENVQIAEGVTITASEEINILDENFYNTLGEDVTLTILGLEGSCDVTLNTFAKDYQIEAICESTSYVDRATSRNQEVEIVLEEIDFTFKLFPNPVEDVLTVNLSIGFDDRVLTYRILDIQGRVVQNESLAVSGNRIYQDVSSFSSGVYLFEVVYPNGNSLKKKFIKQ